MHLKLVHTELTVTFRIRNSTVKVFENIQETMDPYSLGVILCISVPLIVFSEILAWKLYSKWSKTETAVKRRPVMSTILYDPLVSAIVCPMVADLYSSITVLECDASLAIFITFVMMLLYVSALVIGYRLVAIMSPRMKAADGQVDPAILSFFLSIAVNAMLTWTVLSLLQPSHPDAVLYDAEACLITVRQKSSTFIFIMCMVIQMVHVLFYACLSHSVVRNYKHELYEQGVEGYLHEDSDRKAIAMYTIVGMLCLAISNGLRLCFTHCSCHHFMLLAHGLYLTNWVVAIKLPACAFVYVLFKHFSHRVT